MKKYRIQIVTLEFGLKFDKSREKMAYLSLFFWLEMVHQGGKFSSILYVRISIPSACFEMHKEGNGREIATPWPEYSAH